MSVCCRFLLFVFLVAALFERIKMYINQIQSAQTPGAGTADHLFTFALAKK